MLPFKKILWPTDFSEASFRALIAARELADHFSAELLMLHVVVPVPRMPLPGSTSSSNEPSSSFNVNEYKKELEKYGREALEELVRNEVGTGISVRTVILHGQAPEQIAAYATKENVDLIVIATNGLTGLKRFVLGSVTDKVMKIAPCPVLLADVDKQRDEE